jgi:hypothetical protein
MRDFRDPRLWLVILATGLLCCLLAGPAFSEVTITPPPHKVVVGGPALFRVNDLAADDLPLAGVETKPATSRGMLFAGPYGGQFIWFEATANGWHTINFAISTPAKPIQVSVQVEVGGDGPQPNPDPDPTPPPPPPGARHIVVIVERSTPIPTPEQVKVIAALDLWKDSQGYTPETYRVYDPNQLNASMEPVPELQPYLQALQQRGVKHPAIIVDAEPFGSVEDYDAVEAFPATGAEAIEAVKKGGG